MNREEVTRKIDTMRVWHRGDDRALHKPLLVLYAVGALLKGKSRLISYVEIDKNLGSLLSEFSSTRSPQGTDHPFWRLQNDGIWEVTGAERVRVDKRKNPSKGDLLDYKVHGGFTEEIFNLLKMEADLPFEIAQMVLDKHFSTDLHAEILYWAWVDCTGPRAGWP